MRKEMRFPIRFAAGAALLLATAPALSARFQAPDEQIEMQLSPGVVFTVNDVTARAVDARDPFPLTFHNAVLGPGRALRISLRAESIEPPGARVSFQSKNARAGTCRDGQLSTDGSVVVYESGANPVDGGCDLLWTLESSGLPPRAGTYKITLRWTIESVPAAGQAPGAAGLARAFPLLPTACPGPVDERGDRVERRRSSQLEGLRRPGSGQ
jgi:hypothetical protein